MFPLLSEMTLVIFSIGRFSPFTLMFPVMTPSGDISYRPLLWEPM